MTRILVRRDGAPVGWVSHQGINYSASSPGAPVSRGEVWRAERIGDGNTQDFDSLATAEQWLLAALTEPDTINPLIFGDKFNPKAQRAVKS